MVERVLNESAVQETRCLNRDFPEVTIMVLNYNGKEHIDRCLDSIFKMDYPQFNVVVIDNASNDGSVDFVKERYPQVKTLEYPKNHGFAKAYNIALQETRSQFVVLINNDVIVEPEWLSRLMPYIANDKDISAVTPKMLFVQNRKVINAAGGTCDIYGSGWNRGNGEVDSGQYERVEEVFYANGAAIVISRKAWEDVGSFDEDYFLYGEDLDWCWRARLKGYRILYVPSSRIYHKWHASSGEMIPFLERHWLTTAFKNYDSKTLAKLGPKLLALKTLTGVWLLLNGRSIREKLAVFDGFFWNLNELRKTWKKRLSVQASRKIDDEEIQRHMYNGSLELSLGLKKVRHPITKECA
jgi:hypothetical protein